MCILSNFVDFLNEYLTEHNLNPLQFSELLNIPKSNIYNWLNYIFAPSLPDLILIANYCNVSIEYILGLRQSAFFFPASIPSNFSSRFDSLRKEKKFTLAYIARYCNIGASAISKWIHAGKLPKTEILISLSDLFSCSIDYLLGRTDIR